MIVALRALKEDGSKAEEVRTRMLSLFEIAEEEIVQSYRKKLARMLY